jgi:hypothetical protein
VTPVSAHLLRAGVGRHLGAGVRRQVGAGVRPRVGGAHADAGAPSKAGTQGVAVLLEVRAAILQAARRANSSGG